MRALNVAALAGAVASALIGFTAPAWAEADSGIRRQIVRASIDSYPGPCACPYNTDRAGRSCGRRSAYSRPGGYAPKCFPSDVSAEEVKAYRAGR